MEHRTFTTIELKGTHYLYSVDEKAQRQGFTHGYRIEDITSHPQNLDEFTLFLGVRDIPHLAIEAYKKTSVEAIFA